MFFCFSLSECFKLWRDVELNEIGLGYLYRIHKYLLYTRLGTCQYCQFNRRKYLSPTQCLSLPAVSRHLPAADSAFQPGNRVYQLSCTSFCLHIFSLSSQPFLSSKAPGRSNSSRRFPLLRQNPP